MAKQYVLEKITEWDIPNFRVHDDVYWLRIDLHEKGFGRKVLQILHDVLEGMFQFLLLDILCGEFVCFNNVILIPEIIGELTYAVEDHDEVHFHMTTDMLSCHFCLPIMKKEELTADILMQEMFRFVTLSENGKWNCEFCNTFNKLFF